MQDKTLTCRDCGAEFTFTVGEQEFFAEKGFTNEPSRCPNCRAANKANRGGGRPRERTMYPAVCDQCGKETEVPFQPRSGKPVYCSECFAAQRGGGRGPRGSSHGRDEDRW